ncbi:MAG: DUF4252 domain-containing protein [Bacteroidales bacterium]
MKKIFLIAILIAITAPLMSQPAGLERLYYNYKGEEGVVSIRIPGFLLRLAGCIADLDHEERQLVRSLRSVTVLTIEDNGLYPGVNFAEEVDVRHMHGGYHLLMEVHEDEEDVVIAARERGGKIRELIVLVGGSDNVLVRIRGRMNSDLLESLAGVTGIEKLHYTGRI